MRKFIFLVLFLVTSSVAANTSPQVLTVSTADLQDLALEEPVIIQFSLPMMQAETEASIHIEPETGLLFQWINSQTLAIFPETNWQEATSYNLTLNSGAQALNGEALADAYVFQFHTTGRLNIISVTPTADNWQVDANNAQIALAFDRPVVPLLAPSEQANLPSPIIISPDINGEGMWITSSLYIFTPAEALSAGAEYTVTVAGGMVATDGSVLSEDYAWSFRTLNPQTVSMIATEPLDSNYILLDSGFTVTFSQAMDRPSTEAAFELRNYGSEYFGTYDPNFGTELSGTFDWNDENTEFTFRPSERLALSSHLHAYLATTALAENGFASLEEAVFQQFTTVSAPQIQSVYPPDNQSVRAGTITYIMRFNTAINTNTLEGRFLVSPEPSGEIRPVSLGENSFGFEFTIEPNLGYTVTLLAGIEDIYGNAISDDQITTFTTTEAIQEKFIRFSRLPYRFSVAGTYLERPEIQIETAGNVTGRLRIYEVPYSQMPENFSLNTYANDYYHSHDPQTREYIVTPPAYATSENILHEWSVAFDDSAVHSIILSLPDGSPLPMGLYGIELYSPELQTIDGYLLSVANTGITLKRGHGDTLIWLTDYETGAPVSGAEVTVYHQGIPTPLGLSDESGIVSFPEELQNSSEYELMVVEGDGIYGAWTAGYLGYPLAQTDSYLYTDRPLYRRGETVYFRGIFRDRDDATLTVPDLDTVYAIEGEAPHEQILSLNVSETGTFSGSFVISEESNLYSQIRVSDCPPDEESCVSNYSAMVSFEIADFRVPEFEVNVTAQDSEIIAGDPMNVLVSAEYYFGGPVTNANVEWTAYNRFSYSRFRYEGSEQGYAFGSYDWDRIYAEQTDAATTDNAGEYLITASLVATNFSPKEVTVEASIRDETGTAIVGSTSLLVHPANVYIGLRANPRFGSVDNSFVIDLLSIHPDSSKRANQAVDITITEIQWVNVSEDFGVYQWQRQESEFDSFSIQTDANANGQFSFDVSAAGMYRIDATATDEQGRITRTSITVYAQGESQEDEQVWFDSVYQYSSCSYSPEYYRLRLTSDRDTYVPGDLARIFIPNPFSRPATALITIERAGVMEEAVILIEGDALSYEIPITEDFAPTAYVNVVLMAGINEDNPAPQTLRGDMRLTVEPIHKRLNVELSASSEQVSPGETVEFTVRLTDFEGNPVQGEVGLALTDEAVLALRPANAGTLEDAFYPPMALSVSTFNSALALIAIPDPGSDGGCGGGGGGGGGSTALVRDNFIYTPLWEPHLLTDENGMATVRVTMPDNLTRWRLDARATTSDTSFGQNTLNITSTLPMIVRPVAPRFFVLGDRAELGAVINNQTSSEQLVTVTLEIEGARVEDDLSRVVTIAAGERLRVVWLAEIESLNGVDFTVYASSAAFQDAAKPALTNAEGLIPVYRFAAQDTVATSGLLDSAETVSEAISLPEQYSELEGELTIQLDASLAEITLDSLSSLDSFSYESYEYTVSRFLPRVVANTSLTSFGIHDTQLQQDLALSLDTSITLLQQQQNPDGGWGWFGRMESSPYITAYVLLGLVEARDAGYELAVNPIDRAARYLESRLIDDVDFNTADWQLNQQAFLLYVLSKTHIDPERYIAYLEDLFAERVQLSLTGRAYLLLAYAERHPSHAAVIALADDLVSNAIVSATGTHWEDEYYDYRTWDSNTRSNAIILMALIKANPNHPLLPNAIRWLVTARQGDSWETTQEIVWTSMALSAWMSASGDLTSNYAYSLDLNNSTLLNASMSSPTDSETLTIGLHQLQVGAIDTINISRTGGTGTLYYQATLDLLLPADEVPAISRGMIVDKQIFTLEDDTPTVVSSTTVGDIVMVRITVTVNEDIYFFAIEDLLPAGLEVINPRLLTESRARTRPQVSAESSGQFWSWAIWYFDRFELTDRGAEIYADYLPRGTYVFSYQARAVTAGQFQMLPTRAYAIYQPEVYGRTSGSVFTVLGEE